MVSYPFLNNFNMKNKFSLFGIVFSVLSLSVFCASVLFSGQKVIPLSHLNAEEDMYSLTLDGSRPHNGNTEFAVSTKSGNPISFFGENLSSGSSGNYFVSLSAKNKGYIGNGSASGGQYQNALSNLEFVSVIFSAPSGNVGTITLTAGVDSSHLFERHYLKSGVGVTLNTPANYFRITADKTYSTDNDDILIASIELHYSSTCATGEYAETYGLSPAVQNRYCSMKVIQFDFTAYTSVLNQGDYSPESVDCIKYTPYGGVQHSIYNNSSSFTTLNSLGYLDFNSGWLSSQTTGRGWDGYSLFNDGDIFTIEGTFIGTSDTNRGQKFYLPKSEFIVKTIEGQNYIYNYLPIKSIETSTASWWNTNGLLFYSDDNFIVESSDITNVGKLRPYKSDSITLKRNGYPFSIGTDNTGWYCLNKSGKLGGTSYRLEFYQGSINFGDANSIRNGDTIILDGLFITNASDLVYINGYSAKFNSSTSGNTTTWSITQVTDSKDNTVVPEKLNIGVWNGNYHFNDIAKLETAAALGINVIVCVNPVWNSNWNNILNKAVELGIKFIVDPRPYNATLGRYDTWDGTLPSYANHEAVMGFFMYDEPNAKQFSDIKVLKEQFDAVMPEGKVFFVNLLSGACGLEGLYGEPLSEPYAFQYESKYVDEYVNTVDADLYGFDSYPLFDDGYIRKSYFCSFDVWANRAKKDNLPLWYTFLASGHNSGDGGRVYVTPNAAQMRWQTSVALTYGVDGLLGYLYAHSDNGDYSAMVDNSGNIINQNLYNDFRTIVQEYRVWDEEYTNFTWEGTTSYDVGSTNMMFQNLKHNINLSNYSIGVSSTQDLLVGVFQHKFNNQRAYMITNAGSAPQSDYYSYSRYNYNLPYSHSDANVTITFDDVYTGVYVYMDGVKSYHEINSNSYTLTINQLDGAFIVPVK